MAKALILLLTNILIVICGFGQNSTTTTVIDTTHLNLLINSAKKISEENPDSAVTLYQFAAQEGRKTIQNKKNISDELQKVFIQKTIIADLGSGLILYDHLKNEAALECFNRAYSLAKSTNNLLYIGESLFDIAEVYLEQSKYSMAMTNYFKALQEYESIGQSSGAYWCYVGMGIVQKRCGNYPDAINCYEKAHDIAEKSGMKLEAAYCFNNLGVVCYRKGDFKRAMEYYEKALTCFTDMKDDPSASDCMNNMANVYLDQGNPKRALEYLQRSIEFEKVKKDDYRMISRYSNISDAYIALKDYKNALLYNEKSIQLAEKSDDKLMQASTYSVAGNLQLKTGSTDSGLSYLNKAVTMFHETGSKVEEAEGLVDLANAEQDAGRLNDALRHAQQAHKLADSLHVLKTNYVVYSCLSKLWEKNGNTAQSLAFLKQASQLKDSLYNKEKNRAIEEVEAGFTRTRLENENEILQQKERIQKQTLRIHSIAMISLSLFCCLFAVVIWLLYRRYNDSKTLAQKNEELKQKEIDALNENLLNKERELTTKALFITQKNTLIQKMIGEFDALKNDPGILQTRLPQLHHELKMELSPNAWKEFEVQFNEVHPEFQINLMEKYPGLTPMERRLCAFLKLDMNNREIASLTGQTSKSIEVARTRIRKKMDLTHEDNLANFIASI